jgi:ATP-dependent DNA ligase
LDLIELNGDDLRREPFDTRKATLASLLKRAAPGLRLNEHTDAPVFAHAPAARETGSSARTRQRRR